MPGDDIPKHFDNSIRVDAALDHDLQRFAAMFVDVLEQP
jgi:hypothetical protein